MAPHVVETVELRTSSMRWQWALLCAALFVCARGADAGRAAVAMPDAYSAEVAEEVLRAGGNAVDAAVAAAFVLAVTYPEGGNLGGGGFMLIHMEGEAQFLDYRETAPWRAERTMYLDEHGEVAAPRSIVGALAVGVPGTVAGLHAAHERHGTLPWAALVEPAARIARDGFVVAEHLAERRRAAEALYAGKTNFDDYFAGLTEGATFHQPELASTLERIARAGAADFYAGETARLLVAEMHRGGGLIDANDLESYRPVWRKPLAKPWRRFTVLSARSPGCSTPITSSGARSR